MTASGLSPGTAFHKSCDYLSSRLQPARTKCGTGFKPVPHGDQHWQRVVTSRELKPTARVKIMLALLMKHSTSGSSTLNLRLESPRRVPWPSASPAMPSDIIMPAPSAWAWHPVSSCIANLHGLKPAAQHTKTETALKWRSNSAPSSVAPFQPIYAWQFCTQFSVAMQRAAGAVSGLRG